MGNQYLEQAVAALSAQVTQQNAKIAELEKQLTGIQAAMSCELGSGAMTKIKIKTQGA
ncbi:hypothetical protein [Providencia sneebia]|uniref:hypothetical protein n=1 Tax=Providencia sneebia TaxID=516075 RepID=UPI0002E89209|nr:hypothetical protein [Providencia sneebia]